MTPKELFGSRAKHAEQEADRLSKMTPEDKAASKARRIEQEAERVREMTPDEKAASKDQRSTGYLWVTVVYEIKSLEHEAITRQSSGVLVDAADRESPLIPLGPIAEIRGGSSAMQAFAVVCAAMVASTVLQHTALRGVIESERMARSYRVWYKNQFLVS